jgi:multidrug efflux pump subunit AcrA (membrane-fusion protein)
MKFTTKVWKFLRNKKTIIGLIIIIIIVALIALKRGNGEPEVFTLTSDKLATTGVTVGGTVVAQEEVDLSFELSGRIASVPKKAGDRVSQGTVLASLDTGTLSANILKAQGDLDAEIAKLNEYQTQEGSGLTEVDTKKTQLAREIQNAYTVAEDAIKNKNDQFFEDPQSRFPKIYSLFDGYELRQQINAERYEIGLVLSEWQSWATSVSKNNYTDRLNDTRNNIEKVQKYLNLISPVVSRFEADSAHPQADIDKYKTDISAARTNLNTVLTNITDAEEALRSTTSQIPFQEARVKSARAVVQNYQAELAKAIIRAPFNGLVTRQDAKVGMSAMSDDALVSMISDSNYGIETFVPEVYIAQIKVGNKAKVTLNSYGSTENFDATVSYIDPAASLRDGVASYKVELVFDNNDERIKSGMTADVEIMTETVNPSFWVPAAAVIDQGGATYVKIKSGETVELRKVQPGERTETEVEIKSGLIIGDELVLEKKK